ncbi:putative CCR4-Not complex component, Not1, CCR4-NOT transcription complex subunit 1, HEAT [Lupinus albus]|uniref:Putative CCR4-Not complex component, Not1, CCR4-NOT transcription complex subunit 1, HEAT n=1 Tax=Lupinus albus TaxID=3870 RepID=A0A6A4QBB4_LUPAL|nr:putative CCR4-Not complex component, Not1, CCR4-NOT transcription complex subunit 1, HEAT [Lupinus albus]
MTLVIQSLSPITMATFSNTTSKQIRFLLNSLNHLNFDSVFHQLIQFTEFGTVGSILLFQTCLDHFNFARRDMKDIQPERILVDVVKYLLDKPNFNAVFSESMKEVEINESFLESFCNGLKLSLMERVAISLSLSDSENPDAKLCGKNFCMAQIEKLYANPGSLNCHELIHDIIMFLKQSEGLSKHVNSFMQILPLVHFKDTPSFVLNPLLPDEMREAEFLRWNMELFHVSGDNDFDAILDDIQKEMNMGEIVNELGYGCTVDVSLCKEIFSLVTPLTDNILSKLLGSIARTHGGLEDNQSTFLTFGAALGYSNLSELPPLNSWNIDVLIDTINQLAPQINWIRVIEKLDHEGFLLPSEEAFSFLMSVYNHACKEPFPLHAICGSVWKNTEGQLSFLKYAVSAPPEVFTFAHSARQLAYIDAVNGSKLQTGHSNHAWACLDLLDVLCQLAERGHANSVRPIFEYPLKQCPEVLLLGMAHINTAYSLFQHEICLTVFPMILKSTDGSGMILHLWHVNPNLVLRGVMDSQKDDLDNVTRIVDICQELKILSSVVEIIPSYYGIRLAAVAGRKEYLDLEKWLDNNLTTYKDFFFEECLKFLKDVHLTGSQDLSGKSFHQSGAFLNLYAETTATFLKVLKSHTDLVTSTQLSEELERLHISIVDSNPRLQNGGTTDSSASDGYADDIEAEANSYFHQMFSDSLSMNEMVHMLSRFKESSVKREKSIFECMIANLFEEYRFFQKYPERQLKIAAVLFGSVIKHQLVTHLSLGIALRYVLDALRKPADSKMFMFGSLALEQFVDRLTEWPQYCNHILQISHLRSTHSEIVGFIEQALARISSGHADVDGMSHASGISSHNSAPATLGHVEPNASSIIQTGQQHMSLQLQQRRDIPLDDRYRASVGFGSSTNVKPLLSSAGQSSVVTPPDGSNTNKLHSTFSSSSMLASSGFVRPSRGATSTRFGSALNIETLVAAAEKRETPIEAPGSDVQDKISFIINNISVANIETKAKEFTEILKEQYYPWFAQYMVMKRASIEPNFHDLYLKFLDKVNSKALNKEIVQATYENCKVLLGSELIKSSSEERSLLKNLGSWLGKLTIGRNQVLRAREIDPKSLIIEAYEKGLMIAVIPFTSKILEPCQSSLAYQPPNPWTMGILGLLAEIYSMPNLKMNLKFDIEVLFKNLSVDLKEVTPTSLLKDRKREIEGNPDFSNKDVGASQAQMISDIKSGLVPPVNQVDLPLEVKNPSNTGGHPHMLSQYAGPLHISTGTLMEEEKITPLGLSDQLPSAQGLLQATPTPAPFSLSQIPTQIPNIGTHVIINPKLSSFGLQMHFQRAVPIAMDRAIKEIVSSIVQRSVSIATQTTKELVLKDYSMESDETRILNAAHLMVASLAGSLAHVTCKEPLRASISSQLRTSLQNLSIGNEILEQAVQLVTNDNLDLGCAVIEQAATDKAINTIDTDIGQQLSLRRKHREGMGSTFFDSNLYTQGSMGGVPDYLRPKPGQLSLSQQRVYEDFVRLPWQNQSSQSSNSMSAVQSGNADLTGTGGSVSMGYEGVSRQVDDMAESNIASQFSASSIHNRASDSSSQLSLEKDSVASFPSTASTPELHAVDSSDAVKESGASSQPQVSSGAMERFGTSFLESSLTTRDALDKYQIVVQKLEALVNNDSREAEIQGVISEVPEILLRCVSRDEAALAVAQKVFKGLYDNASNSIHVGAHLGILTAIRDVCKLAVKELTSWVIYSEEERKFNKDITVGLIRSELLNLTEYNVHMAKLIDGGRNKAAMEFSISLLQTLVIEEPEVISELHNLIDALAKLATKPGSPESLLLLVEMVKNPTASAAALSAGNAGKDDKARQSRDNKGPGLLVANREELTTVESVEPDPAGFRDQISMSFAEWYRICELPGANDTASSHFILQLHQNGLLKGDDLTDRFFRLLMELAVTHCLSTEVINSGGLQSPQQLQPMSFLAIDIYAKLVFSILKGSSKPFLLSKILSVTVRFILKDVDEKKMSFNPRPYFRLFINWLLDLGSLEPVTDGANLQILTAFANAFHALQPLKVPGFSFAWLELISHRSFMPKMLTGNGQKGWPYIQRLLVDLFQFMEPFLRHAELGDSVRLLYKGTLRVLLVLLHDFPEFLCDYHFTFCDVIPPSCIQMRNIILSAFPRSMRLPDPSTPNLKIDLLQEITQSPRILSEVDAALKAKQMKSDVDEYLKTRQQNSPFLSELKEKLLLSPSEAASAGTRYNVPLINSLVLYVGMQAIQQLQGRTPHAQSAANAFPLAVFSVGAALDIFQTLIMDLDTEGRYLFLNAVANQLRYPNTHTHYFSFILLYLFAESNQEIIQEQITRVLLERLIVNRPHPWGLLITFIELIKNPRYNFWNRSFIRCAPEIEKLFESVSRSCGGPKPVDESMVSGWV